MCEYVYIRSSVSGFNAKQILLLNYDLEVYGLANIKSAKKRVITSQVRAERNKAIKSRVKTYIKKVEAAVAAGDKAAANEALPVAIAEIEKAASKESSTRTLLQEKYLTLLKLLTQWLNKNFNNLKNPVLTPTRTGFFFIYCI